MRFGYNGFLFAVDDSKGEVLLQIQEAVPQYSPYSFSKVLRKKFNLDTKKNFLMKVLGLFWQLLKLLLLMRPGSLSGLGSNIIKQ
jgi:hypothetical protein